MDFARKLSLSGAERGRDGDPGAADAGVVRAGQVGGQASEGRSEVVTDVGELEERDASVVVAGVELVCCWVADGHVDAHGGGNNIEWVGGLQGQ